MPALDIAFTATIAGSGGAPTLSSLSVAGSSVAATLYWSTDTPNGTAYAVITDSATVVPYANIEAGQNATGAGAVASAAQQVTAAGAQDNIVMGGLTPGDYYVHFFHKNGAGQNSPRSVIGPVTISAASGGGVVSLTFETPDDIVPGSSIIPKIVWDNTTFVTPGPATAYEHDRRVERISCYINHDEAGTFDKVPELPAAMRQRNASIDHDSAFQFLTPGVKTFTVTLIEEGSGRSAQGTAQITIGDADATFLGALTICVNPVNDNSFTDAPSGAVLMNADEITTSGAVWTEKRNGGQRKRVLLKRGADYPGETDIVFNSLDANVYFDSYGPGTDRPTLHGPTGVGFLRMFESYQDWNPTKQTDCLFRHIEMLGGYNSRTNQPPVGGGTDYDCFYMLSRARAMFHDCRFNGFTHTITETNNTPSTVPGESYTMHAEDCDFGNWGGQYHLYAGDNYDTQTAWITRGNRIQQPNDAISGASTMRALQRCNMVFIQITQSNYMAHRDVDQPVLKCAETPQLDGLRVTVTWNHIENGLDLVSTGRNQWQTFGGDNSQNNPDARSAVITAMFQQNIMVGGMRTRKMVGILTGGVTVRDNLMIMPDIPFWIDTFGDFITTQRIGSNEAEAAPIRVYHNHFINLRSQANNTFGGNTLTTPVEHTGDGRYSDIEVVNNLFHSPAFGVTIAGLDTTTQISATYDTLGRKDPVTLAVDPQYATPEAAMRTYRMTGTVLRATNGTQSPRAMFNVQRDNILTGATNAALGCYETAA